METNLDQATDPNACVDPACADSCCQEPPGFARAYWIGMGALFGLLVIGSALNALLS